MAFAAIAYWPMKNYSPRGISLSFCVCEFYNIPVRQFIALKHIKNRDKPCT